jgi:hypothetical protein
MKNIGKIYVRQLAMKAPKPDELEALGKKDEDETPESNDDDASDAALNSAFDDFVKAIGGDLSKRDEALDALKDLLRYCK